MRVEIDESMVVALSHFEPASLAILFMGIVSLALIWLAAVAIKTSRKQGDE